MLFLNTKNKKNQVNVVIILKYLHFSELWVFYVNKKEQCNQWSNYLFLSDPHFCNRKKNPKLIILKLFFYPALLLISWRPQIDVFIEIINLIASLFCIY